MKLPTALPHELVEGRPTPNACRRLRVFGELNGRVYEIEVSASTDRRYTKRAFWVGWSVRQGWSLKSGWRSWQCRRATEAEAMAFAVEKLETLRGWAAKGEAA